MPTNRRIRHSFRTRLAALSLYAGSGLCMAAAPVWIDGSELGLRDDLAWLADRGLISLGLATWPQPLGVVEGALDKIRPGELEDADRDALARARAALQRLQGGAAIGARVNTARHPSAGADPAPRARIETYAQMQGTGLSPGTGDAPDDSSVAWRLRGRLQEGRIAREPSPLAFDGSYLAVGGDEAVLSCGAVERWWGPGRHASVLLGDAAPPVLTLMLRRGTEDAPSPRWLAWIGPWTYEFSVGRPNHYEPRGANTIGMRLVARPIAGVELGLARYIYWGGDGRPRSLKSLGKALAGQSNIDDPATQGPDPSNEIAGIDLRVALPLGSVSAVGYAQVAGEDEAQAAPSKLMTTAGLQIKHASTGWRWEWTFEGSDTRLGRSFGFGSNRGLSAYQHSTYIDGHYHQGLPIGAYIGGGGVAGSIGLSLVPLAASDERRYEARVWQANVSTNGAEPINAAFGVPGAVKGLLLQTSGLTPRLRWHAGLSIQDYPQSNRRSAGFVGGIEWPLDLR